MMDAAPAPAPVLTPDQVRRFLEDGYVVVKGVVATEDCAAMASAAWAMMPDRFDIGDHRTWRGRIQDCCNDIPLYQRKGLVRFKAADGFRSIPAVERGIHGNARLQAMFARLCPSSPEVIRVRGLNPNLPFPRSVSLNELIGNRMENHPLAEAADAIRLPCPPQFPIPGHLEAHAMDVGAFIYLSDVGRSGGGVAVWPGSHRLFGPAFDSPTDFKPNRLYTRLMKLFQARRPRVIEGQTGDVILFHNRLLHGNTFNHSGAIRHLAVVDVLGERLLARAAQTPSPALTEVLLAAPRLRQDPRVVAVLAPLRKHRLAAFLLRHRRLNQWILSLSKDPVAAGRSRLSTRIRQRQPGDVWVIVSQGTEHRDSYKLDAYGRDRLGRFSCRIDEDPPRASLTGMLVEQYLLEGGEHRLQIAGRFDTTHYVRVLQTAAPFADSPILFSAEIAAGADGLIARFVVPHERAVMPADDRDRTEQAAVPNDRSRPSPDLSCLARSRPQRPPSNAERRSAT